MYPGVPEDAAPERRGAPGDKRGVTAVPAREATGDGSIAWLCAAAVAAAGVLPTVAGRVQRPCPGRSRRRREIRVLPLRGNVYVLTGAGANIVASVGKDGVMLVDTGAPAMADKVLAAVQDLSRRVTAAPMAARSCVGVSQGCGWWSSSEFLPTTAGPRAPRPIAGIIYTSDDAGPHRRQRSDRRGRTHLRRPQHRRHAARRLGAGARKHHAASEAKPGAADAAAQRDLLRRREEAQFLQRRSGGRDPHAGGPHRRRQRGLFPRVRSDGGRRLRST